MKDKKIDGESSNSLNLNDLLVDDGADLLSEYLSVSLESLAEGTKVSVTTVEDTPTVYTTTLSSVSVTDLHYLIDGSGDTYDE